MTHLPDIWSIIRFHMPRDTWMVLGDIYDLVEQHTSLDEEDMGPQAPGSTIPKWKRNVRNVLQYRKRTGEVLWNGDSHYLIA
jgi:hypothetical protein